jgi:hypothetical protein
VGPVWVLCVTCPKQPFRFLTAQKAFNRLSGGVVLPRGTREEIIKKLKETTDGFYADFIDEFEEDRKNNNVGDGKVPANVKLHLNILWTELWNDIFRGAQISENNVPRVLTDRELLTYLYYGDDGYKLYDYPWMLRKIRKIKMDDIPRPRNE